MGSAHKFICVLNLADLATLARLGVDTGRHSERDCSRTQPIGDPAYFLGFDGLLAPGVRWPRANLVLFTDRITAERNQVADREHDSIAWDKWRKRTRQHTEARSDLRSRDSFRRRVGAVHRKLLAIGPSRGRTWTKPPTGTKPRWP